MVRLFVLLARAHVNKDEYGAMVECYRQGKAEVLGERCVSVLLCPPQTSQIALF